MLEVASLALTARLGVPLFLFAGYSQSRGVDHPKVGRYVDYLWAFVGIKGE